jgi:uncharacterized membrane protein AbrB (regulator of aidB expression)
MDASDDELSIWNMNSIFTYMKDHFIQILMLLSVFVIIYVVDHISNINTAIFSMPSAIPGMPSLQNKQIQPLIKGKRHYKKAK